jgi:Fructose-2,6-bisphosphatase
MTRFIVIRHGQSEGNHNQVFQGQGEYPLTELGQKQASATADFLSNTEIHAFYASDLSRAKDTAKQIADRYRKPVVLCKRFRELDVGLWQGVRYDEVKNAYPKEWDLWLNDIGNSHCNGGESMRQMQHRASTAFDELANKHNNQTVCVVTHGAVIRSMTCIWNSLDITEMLQVEFFSNASISIVDYLDDNRKRIVVQNKHDHLENLVTEFPKTI